VYQYKKACGKPGSIYIEVSNLGSVHYSNLPIDWMIGVG